MWDPGEGNRGAHRSPATGEEDGPLGPRKFGEKYHTEIGGKSHRKHHKYGDFQKDTGVNTNILKFE